MKAVLEYNLPEETEEYNLAINGVHAQSAIDEVYSWIRAQLKYNDLITEQQIEILESLREHLTEYIRRE